LKGLRLLNMRVARSLHVWTGHLDAAIDVLNVTNSDADQAFQPGAELRFSPLFGQGTTRQFPRAVKASLRLAF